MPDRLLDAGDMTSTAVPALGLLTTPDGVSNPYPLYDQLREAAGQAPADDPRLRHKTTDRALYRDALRRGGTYEVLLTDAEGFLTEGCFSTLFVERGDKLVTPPLRRGLLPGILRQSLIEMGEAVEEDLRIHDLERGFFIGNAARGMVAATLAR